MSLPIQALNSECAKKLAYNPKLTSGYCLWAMLMLHLSSLGNCILYHQEAVLSKKFYAPEDRLHISL